MGSGKVAAFPKPPAPQEGPANKQTQACTGWDENPARSESWRRCVNAAAGFAAVRSTSAVVVTGVIGTVVTGADKRAVADRFGPHVDAIDGHPKEERITETDNGGIELRVDDAWWITVPCLRRSTYAWLQSPPPSLPRRQGV